MTFLKKYRIAKTDEEKRKLRIQQLPIGQVLVQIKNGWLLHQKAKKSIGDTQQWGILLNTGLVREDQIIVKDMQVFFWKMELEQ